MTPMPIWFGSRARPLAGFLHQPVRPPVGGVLICAPFGYEAGCAHRTLRTIADRLASLGHLVLRFDYEGAGASSGLGNESDLLDRWRDSVRAGVAELRRLGIRRPALVGLRLGGALALAATRDDPDLGPVAVWAPVTSGRRYWRELRAQAAITPGGIPGDGSLNVVGHRLPAAAVGAVKAWNPLAGVQPVATALVQSPGWRDADATADELVAAGVHPTLLELDGTSEVLEQDAEMVKVPVRLVDGLCDWVHNASAVTPTEVPGPTGDPARPLDDGVIQEEIVSIPPHGLYGVLTRPAGEPSQAGVLFLNNGVATAAGPGRAWVEFARTLAADGVTSLRLDFSGLGNSPDPQRWWMRRDRVVRRERGVPRTASAELLAAAEFLRRRGIRTVTAAGLCTGAQISVRTAAYGDGLDAVFAINPPLCYLPNHGIGPWRRRLWALTAEAVGKRPVRAAMRRLPEWVWTGLDRLGLFPSPAHHLRRAAARGTRVQLVFSEHDEGLLDLRALADRAVGRLVEQGDTAMLLVDGMDHSMFDHAHRADVLDALREACGVRSSRELSAQPIAAQA
jgi:dienelactone hydrolase